MQNEISYQAQVEAKIEHFRTQVNGQWSRWLTARDPNMFRAVELEVAAVARDAADAIMEAILRHIAEDKTLENEAVAAARTQGRYRGRESRSATITLLGGQKVTLRTPYLKPNRRGLPGRPRGVGRRGKAGSGVYPVLAALGIWYGVTPALATEVCRQVADSDSLRAGRKALARRGADLGQKQVHRIVSKVGQRAVQQRLQWVEGTGAEAPISETLAAKRVVIAIDGGRIRERVPQRQGRRRASGHRGFATPWREPKLFVLYTVDDDGNVVESFRPVYDGTLGDCNAQFSMLSAYLGAMGVRDAREVVVVGDGAKWIWERTHALLDVAGVPRRRVTEVIDWYHAVETLHEIAAMPANWTPDRRNRWAKRAQSKLARGNIDGVLDMMEKLAVGRRAGRVNKHKDYFERNRDRMQYSTFKSKKIPRGSGAVESAVRRIVNMRMKANGSFWLEENAEGMLMLRSYLKSDRFDDLMDWSLRTAASWWSPATELTSYSQKEAA